jgi:Ca2+/H+ antiporter
MNPLLAAIRHQPMLLIAAYALGLLFSLKTHRELFAGADMIATLTAALVTVSGRSAWFVGVLVLMVYATFAMALYLLPPRVP